MIIVVFSNLKDSMILSTVEQKGKAFKHLQKNQKMRRSVAQLLHSYMIV